ncbi:MAG: DNA polymerase III subunit alpha [Desulfobacterales bacterium]|nr:DNA polymerase III subunit alpha [Desulfobacterales bacterium]
MIPSADFVHLHVHTQYSLLDGAIRIDSLLKRAASYQMISVAITDHGTMYGVIEFYEKAYKAGIKPIIGCEIYVAPRSRFDKTPGNKRGLFHLVLLAKNKDGYQNLCRLVTAGHLEGFYYKPRVDKEILAGCSRGLIALSGCLHGEIPRLIQAGRLDKAGEVARTYEAMFGKGNFYLEVQNNGIEAQEGVNHALREMSERLSIPLVATNDCHYLDPEDAHAHDVLLCIQTGKTVKETNRLKFQTDQLYFKSPEEMKLDFRDYPGAIEHSVEIGNRCNLELDLKSHHFPRFRLESYGPPEDSGSEVIVPGIEKNDEPLRSRENGVSGVDEYLEREARKGLEMRLEEIRSRTPDFSPADSERYQKRLDRELDVIKGMGFAGYFLVVADFVRFARESNIPVGPGRGSAAGSLVAYSLGITDLDPIAYGLIFERFLNPARKSLPDIDIDFCIEGRDTVFRYVVEKYGGPDYVAQIITFGKMQARAVIRDVGRALDIPLREVDTIAKMIPEVLNISLGQAISQEPKLRNLAKERPYVKELFTIAQALEGLPRHASTHAAGVVISDRPLVEYLPLARGKKGEVVTQYDMNAVEKIGLIKFDFLGLRNLTVMKEACEIIRKQGGIPPDLARLDVADKKTYQLLASAQTTGVFQLESSGMKDLLSRLKPACFEDITALVALYRPGPLDSGMHNEFVERKNGRVAVTYLLPELEPILRDTYGVILYQEQVMNIASELADYSMAEADNLRKAMGKKIGEIMAQERERFLSRAKKKGMDEEKAENVFNQIQTFGRYGFNKAHSAAYAMIAFQTAYLKAHFPVELMAAILTSEMGSTEEVVKYIAECRNQGIEILPPDINQSDTNFTVVEGKIRFGLAAVKNVGQGAIESVLEVRKQGGSFKSLFDFCERVDHRKVNRRVVESLIKSGAFDSTAARRSQMMSVLEEAFEAGQKIQKDRINGQFSLFEMMSPDSRGAIYPPFPEIEEWNEGELLKYEQESVGFFITGHPLGRYEPILKKFSNADSVKLQDLSDGRVVRIGGIVRDYKRYNDKKGGVMAFVTLEDLSGLVEVTLFSSLYSTVSGLIEKDSAVMVEGRVTKDEKSSKILADTVVPIDQAEATWTTGVHLNVDMTALNKESLRKLCEILKQHKGSSSAYLHLLMPQRTDTIIALPASIRVKAGQDLTQAVNEFLGYSAVETVCQK